MERRGATGSHGCGSVARGELGTGREREGLDLGELEVGVEVLTVGSIELWWLIVGDRGFEDVGAEEEEIGRRERMSGTEQGAQGGDLAPSLLSVGARPACRWPLLLSCHHGSRPSRPHTSTAGQSHGQGACKAADDCGARKTVLPLAEARAGSLFLHRAGMPQQLRRSTEAWPGNGWGGAYRRRGSRGRGGGSGGAR